MHVGPARATDDHATEGRGPKAGAGPRCRWWVLLAAWLAAPAAALAQAGPGSPGLTLDAAVARALSLDAEIGRARWAVEEAVGALEQAQGAFDLGLTASATRLDAGDPTVSSSAPETVTDYELGLTQRFRWGLVATPRVSLQRSEYPAQGLPPSNSVAYMGLGLDIPLLRSRGGGLATAAETAARQLRQASGEALEHQRGRSVLGVVQAYWGYVAAARRLAVLDSAESRAERLVDDTRALIAADERPAADEVRVRANLASKRAGRLAVERGLLDARAALAEAMGVPPEAMAALPPPATALPDFLAGSRLPTAAEATALALERRRDLMEAQREWRAASALAAGARSEARPRFDLSVDVGYRGVEAATALEAFSATGGVRVGVGLTFGLPVQNRAATGIEQQQQARLAQAEIGRDELARRIALDAGAAAERLATAAEGLSHAREAAALYAQDVRSEQARYRLGASTLFDLLFSQDALTAAALAELEAQLGYATSLARLRFETGTLVDGSDTEASVDTSALIAWPAPPAPGGGAALRD